MAMLQAVEVVADEAGRLAWLSAHLPACIDNGDVLVFASQKAKVDELTARLKAQGCRYAAPPLHFVWRLAGTFKGALIHRSSSQYPELALCRHCGFTVSAMHSSIFIILPE